MKTIFFGNIIFGLILLFNNCSALTNDFTNIEEVLYSNMETIKSEMKRLLDSIQPLESIVYTLYYARGILRANQNMIHSKLNNVLSKVENLKAISAVVNNSSHTTSAKGNCITAGTALALKGIPNEIRSIKEALNKKEFCRTTGNSNAHNSLPEISEDTIMEKILNNKATDLPPPKTCENVAQFLIPTVNFFFHLNSSLYEETVSNLEKCWTELPKTMQGFTYFRTPELKFKSAVNFCYDNGGKPFVPKSQVEFVHYVAMSAEPKSATFSWYAINDIETEGKLIHNDGTDYESGSFKLEKWDERWENSEDADCVTVDIFGVASWSRCFHYDFPLLCRKEKLMR